MIRREDFFNDESICIFTDSSFKNLSRDRRIALGVTAPAACVYHNYQCIDRIFNILYNSNSQEGELRALLLGVMESYKYRNFAHIRIFSDSLNSIFAVRDRIFTWIKNTPKGIDELLNSSGKVKNLDMIMDIIYYILSNNIPIELYHVKGHVNFRDRESFEHARQVFLTSNIRYNTYVEDDLIGQLVEGNTDVDNFSTQMLNKYYRDPRYTIYDGLQQAVSIGYTPFNIPEYCSLINKDGYQKKHIFDY